MNKQQVEVDLVTKAHEATHRIRQPSWAAHCQALSINMDEAEKESNGIHTRPTIKIQTPAYDFRPTPLVVMAVKAPPPPKQEELELDWDT